MNYSAPPPLPPDERTAGRAPGTRWRRPALFIAALSMVTAVAALIACLITYNDSVLPSKAKLASATPMNPVLFHSVDVSQYGIHPALATSASFSPDGKCLALIYQKPNEAPPPESSGLLVYDLEHKKLNFKVNCSYDNQISWTRDGEGVLSPCVNSKKGSPGAVVYSKHDGHVLYEFPADESANAPWCSAVKASPFGDEALMIRHPLLSLSTEPVKPRRDRVEAVRPCIWSYKTGDVRPIPVDFNVLHGLAWLSKDKVLMWGLCYDHQPERKELKRGDWNAQLAQLAAEIFVDDFVIYDVKSDKKIYQTSSGRTGSDHDCGGNTYLHHPTSADHKTIVFTGKSRRIEVASDFCSLSVTGEFWPERWPSRIYDCISNIHSTIYLCRHSVLREDFNLGSLIGNYKTGETNNPLPFMSVLTLSPDNLTLAGFTYKNTLQFYTLRPSNPNITPCDDR